MATSLTIKPIIPVAPSVAQQSNAINFKAQLAQDDKSVKNGNLSQLEQISRKTMLEAKLQEAQATPVKYTEDVKQKSMPEIKESSAVSSPGSPVRNIENGKQYSHNEKTMMLLNQMNQLAASNRVLHGLF